MDNLKCALMKTESRWNWAFLPKSHHEQASTMCRFCTTVLLQIPPNCVYWSVSTFLSVKTPIQIIRCSVHLQYRQYEYMPKSEQPFFHTLDLLSHFLSIHLFTLTIWIPGDYPDVVGLSSWTR